jgi:excisionase family DNA binding protein
VTHFGNEVRMRLLTVREVIDRTSLSRATVYALIRSGQLPSVKIGTARRVRQLGPRRDIEAHREVVA